MIKGRFEKTRILKISFNLFRISLIQIQQAKNVNNPIESLVKAFKYLSKLLSTFVSSIYLDSINPNWLFLR